MMTLYCVLKLAHKWQINCRNYIIAVSSMAVMQTGTTASLREGDHLTLEQLFYGMMLPSGNDAAYALAEHFG